MNASPQLGESRIVDLEVLARDDDVVVCRGRRDGSADGTDRVLVQRPTSAQPSSAALDRLVHEYGLRDELDGAWAVRPLQLVREGGEAILVLEDPGGALLGTLLQAKLTIEQALEIGANVAAALGALHKRGLIHKDVKPNSILVSTTRNEVRLTGFGHAAQLPRERQPAGPLEAIGGTLAYMAPEQTGRMNRSVDSRSDLYSLGVTLYQMVTGRLPFSATDPVEWVHCHIARTPPRPDARLVPAPVSNMLMKLLAKTAEERYQTAAGVEHDLRRCLSEIEQGVLAEFELGQANRPDRLLVPEKLYGRQCEVEILLASFDRVARNGTPELVLVSGYSGIGKSSVVNELHKALVPSGGLFASGKFDQYKRDVPYATLAQALHGLVRLLLSKSDADLSGWRAAFIEALGPHGRLMTDLVPDLALIVGEQAPVPELPAFDAQRRFQRVLRRLISVFAQREHPLALFLDDLQWLDAATLDLLDSLLVRDAGVSHLLLIGAYRDNEVDASHPLAGKLRAIKATRASLIQEITLGALDTRHVSDLLADALHANPDELKDLTQLVLQKTGGNPFFINQFLSSLSAEALISFDTERLRWAWDLPRIHAKGYTDNVADLMSRKVVRLPPSTRAALQYLACIGHVASTATLAMVIGTTEHALHASLIEARRQDLVDVVERSYRFVHDRVQEAAYASIPAGTRASLHLEIGRKLVADTPPEKLNDTVFDIVDQLNRASSLMDATAEREQLAAFNLMAGRRAQAASAYLSALSYLAAGAALLTEESWWRQRDLIFGLELARAQCEFAFGLSEEAERRAICLSGRAIGTDERVSVACLQIELYQAADRNGDAVSVGLDALRYLGIDIPDHPTPADARGAYDRVWTWLGDRAIEDLLDLPSASDPNARAALDLLIRVSVPGHHFQSIHLMAVIVCRAVSLGIERGHNEASCIAYAQMGFLAGPVFGQFDAGYRFGRLGCDLAERPGFQRFQGRIFEAFGFILGWTQHVRNGRPFLLRAFDLARQNGEISYAGYASAQLGTNYLMAGDSLVETQAQAEHGLAFARKSGLGTAEGWILGQLGLIRTLRGLTARFGAFDDAGFGEAAFEHELQNNSALTFPKFWYFVRKLQARFFSGEYEAGLQAASIARPLLQNYAFVLECAEFYFYDALCNAQSLKQAAPEDRAARRARLAEDQVKLDGWARHCPENFENRAALVGAEIARLEGRDTDAMDLYERAIRLARAQGFVQNEGLAHELAAQFYGVRGLATAADAHLRCARLCYRRWGANGKVRQIESFHPHLASVEDEPSTSAAQSALRNLDITTVVKALQAVSGEIELPKLIDRLMTIALENAGADRGLLILPAGDDYAIWAEARIEDGRVEVTLRQDPITRTSCPETLIRYVIRTSESVILDDVSRSNLFSSDPYFLHAGPRSILCLPLIKRQGLTGILLLENTLASHAFTAERTAILELLGVQAAISLENARLYGDLSEREAKVRSLVDANIVGIFIWSLEGNITEANEAFLEMVGYRREEIGKGGLRWTDLTPPQERTSAEGALRALATSGKSLPSERSFLHKDGSQVPVLVGSAAFGGQSREGVAFVIDLTERKQAEAQARETERRYRNVQLELEHANRVATLGLLSASIAHEVNQPIAASITNAQTGMRWLNATPPNIGKAQEALDRILANGNRAGEVIAGVRALIKKDKRRTESLAINDLILEVVALTRDEALKAAVPVRTRFAKHLPPVRGDKVQLQQVVLNLVMNALDAMLDLAEKGVLITTDEAASGDVLVAVADLGPGLNATGPEHIFEAFYTTKASGLGLGLAICRTIVEAHGGRLWATANAPRGAVFQFTVPAAPR